MKEVSSSTGKTNKANVQRDKRKQCPPPKKKNKKVWELKPERKDDYFNSQLSDRLSSLLLTSSVHLAHVKHAQHFCTAKCFGTFVARHRYSGRPTEKTRRPPCSKTLPAFIRPFLLLQNGAAAPPAAELQRKASDSVVCDARLSRAMKSDR